MQKLLASVKLFTVESEPKSKYSRLMKQKLGNFFIHPFALSLINFMMLILVYSSLKLTWFHLDPTDHFHEAVELWEGFGTILLGYGVILEERSTLKNILKIKIDHDDPVEELCHDFGVYFVIFGVLIEIFAWLVKIPNEVLDTYQVELVLINVSAIVAFISACFQLRFGILLHSRPPKKHASAHPRRHVDPPAL